VKCIKENIEKNEEGLCVLFKTGGLRRKTSQKKNKNQYWRIGKPVAESRRRGVRYRIMEEVGSKDEVASY